MKGVFWSLDLKEKQTNTQHLALGFGRRRPPNPPAFSHRAPHEEMQIH